MFALGPPLALVVPLFVVVGFGFAMFDVSWDTAIAERIPPHAISRVSAYDWMGSLALLPLGYLIAGPLADAFGARVVLGVGSVIGIVLLLLGLLPRETRELGSTTEEAAGDVAIGVGGEA